MTKIPDQVRKKESQTLQDERENIITQQKWKVYIHKENIPSGNINTRQKLTSSHLHER